MNSPQHGRVVGGRLAAVYRGTMIVFFNTVLLLMVLECMAACGLWLRDELSPKKTALPEYYYASQSWGAAYGREDPLSRKFQYRPYVGWRRQPFHGSAIQIDSEGIRQTPGAQCAPGSYKVFAFGGSTMWGTGTPDWGTVAAYLQAGLQTLKGGPVCVVNYGESAFVSTQGVIELLRQVRSGNVPAAVVFYDGINDTYSTYQSGHAGLHQNLDAVAAKFVASPLLELVKTSHLFQLMQYFLFKMSPEARRSYRTVGGDTEALSAAIVQAYLGNYQVVGALAKDYGFEYFFFWQPVIAIHEKSLTAEEQTNRATLDPALVALFQAVYAQVETALPHYAHLHSLAGIFAQWSARVWIDRYHVTPEANQAIAQAMLAVMQPQGGAQ